MSEALILASTNPQYDKRLFIELQAQYMKIANSEHGENMGRTCYLYKLFWVSKQKIIWVLTTYIHNMFWTCSELATFMYWACNSMNNLLSYCGLVNARMNASEKDLPVFRSGLLSRAVTLLLISIQQENERKKDLLINCNWLH